METYRNVESLWNLLKDLYTIVLLMYVIKLHFNNETYSNRILIMKRI